MARIGNSHFSQNYASVQTKGKRIAPLKLTRRTKDVGRIKRRLVAPELKKLEKRISQKQQENDVSRTGAKDDEYTRSN